MNWMLRLPFSFPLVTGPTGKTLVNTLTGVFDLHQQGKWTDNGAKKLVPIPKRLFGDALNNSMSKIKIYWHSGATLAGQSRSHIPSRMKD